MKMDIRADCAAGKDRSVCLACGAALPEEPLAVFSDMPASAQDIPAADEVSLDHGVQLKLCQCTACGLVQFSCEPVTYYKEVIRAVGLSETMCALRRADYRHLVEDYGLSGQKLIECGCGNGAFLEVLREFPVQIYGMEADRAQAETAEQRLNQQDALDGKESKSWKNLGSCRIYNAFPDTAELELPDAPFDCFLSFNFLEHQPDPRAMLGAMYRNLRPGGIGLITVPSFEYIIEAGRYYELIRDHIANYSMDALCCLCQSCGFTVLEQGFLGIGDTLRVIVKKPECEDSQRGQSRFKKEAPVNLLDVSPLLKNYQSMREELSQYLSRLEKEGRSIAMWGASHQGFTIAATTALAQQVRYIIDSAPFKQGRFAPASHIPIVSPEHFFEEPVDVILIAAPGYRAEIEQRIRECYAAYPKLKVCDLIDLRER